MNYTEQLKEEHKSILLMLEILEKICDSLDAGDSVDIDHLNGIVEFLTIFADKCHHGKEEDLLFPAMEKVGIPNKGGPIGVMLLEHEKGREYITGFRHAVSDYASGKAGSQQAIIENARNYITLLYQHITKEDTVLYPLADANIPLDVQEKLLEQFDVIERERIGIGKHEEFHTLLKQLKSEYLT